MENNKIVPDWCIGPTVHIKIQRYIRTRVVVDAMVSEKKN